MKIEEYKIQPPYDNYLHSMYYVRDLNIQYEDFLPDGHPEFMISSTPLSVYSNSYEVIKPSNILLWGQIRFSGKIRALNCHGLCGVKFQPWILPELSKKSSTGLIDSIINGNRIFSIAFIKSVQELSKIDWNSTQQKDKIGKKIALTFLNELEGRFSLKYNFIDIIKQIKHDRGTNKVSELLPNYGQSLRTLDNDFRKYIGISPKEYHNIIRLRKASLDLKKGKNILHTGLDLGYYDNSHFSREFKRFSSKSPRKFASQKDFVLCKI